MAHEQVAGALPGCQVGGVQVWGSPRVTGARAVREWVAGVY